jgi:hypothetical protein
MLVNTMHSSFIFRKQGDSTCIAVVSKVEQLDLAKVLDAVPMVHLCSAITTYKRSKDKLKENWNMTSGVLGEMKRN